MSIPKRKTDIKIYNEKILMARRQEMLDEITKSDVNLPDSILHDDLDRGMLDYIKKNFKVVSDNKTIPVIDKILTIQRWGEFSNNWEFTDENGNVQLPFVAIIRKPDVQPGTNPSVQRTIPDRHQFYYAAIQTWNGTQKGADIYKIPQPVPVDISYDVTIVCNKFRDANRFNKIVLQHFPSRQDYTRVKGHYIPIVLDKIEDNTPMDTMDGRRFYIQNYQFTILGFLIDSDEFEVKPAVSRFLLMNEFIEQKDITKSYLNKTMDIIVASFKGDGMQTSFSVGETIGMLFNVALNGLIQVRDVDYYFIPTTSKITFTTPPRDGSIVTITYYKGNVNAFIDFYGTPLRVSTEYYIYDGTSLIFQLNNVINSVVSFDINGLTEQEGIGFDVSGKNTVTLLLTPVVGSKIGVTYIY